MKRTVLLGLSALVFASVGTLAIKKPVVAFAEGEEPLTSEVVETSSLEEVSETEPTSISYDISVMDGDGDHHIYTKEELEVLLEKYYNDNIRDQYMFGIELGALIGMATSLLGMVYTVYKNRKSAKKNELASENVGRLEVQVKELHNAIESLMITNSDTSKEYVGLVSSVLEQLKVSLEEVRDVANKLPEYKDLKDKIDNLGRAIKEANSTFENVVNGNAEKVANIIDEVK